MTDCANCGHAQNLHFPWCTDAYVPGKCNYGYDLCGCRDYKSGGLDASQEKAPTVAQAKGSDSRMEEQAQDETLEEVLAAIRQDREALATVAGAVDKWKTACEEQRPPEEVLEIVDTWLEDNSPDNVEIFSWQVVYAEHWARVKAWRDKQ